MTVTALTIDELYEQQIKQRSRGENVGYSN